MPNKDAAAGTGFDLDEQKISVVLNYYVRGDTGRHERFDDFVYDGATA